MPSSPSSLSVAYLGPEGSYSHAAALSEYGDSALYLPVGDIPEVFTAVEQGLATDGVVPIENSSEGSVTVTLDRLLLSSLTIVSERLLPIHHCLLAKPGTEAGQITRILSHQQSLGQCRQWLNHNYPGLERVAVSSNSEAARLASATPGVAAVAGKTASEIYGLNILADSIEDAHDNTTRFVCLRQYSTGILTGHDKTSLFILAQNEPGTLFRALEPFHRHGINLSKLESRPTRKAAWSYSFYVDIEGHADDPDIKAALAELDRLSIEVKLLGSYPVAKQNI